jgi:hypothetical protein
MGTETAAKIIQAKGSKPQLFVSRGESEWAKPVPSWWNGYIDPSNTPVVLENHWLMRWWGLEKKDRRLLQPLMVAIFCPNPATSQAKSSDIAVALVLLIESGSVVRHFICSIMRIYL